MKKIILIASVLVLVGAGCSKSVNDASQDNVANIAGRELSGTWEFAGLSVWSGMSHVNMDLSVDEQNKVNGTFVAILNKPGVPAAYIDEGAFSGEVIHNQNGPVLKVIWEGDREDKGTATAFYNKEKKVLEWIGTIETDDGLYTIPENMELVKSDVVILPEQEWALHSLAEQRAVKIMDNPRIEASSDRLWASFARIKVQPQRSVTDSVYVYMKKESDGWKYVAGPGIDSKEAFLETGLPLTLFYSE